MHLGNRCKKYLGLLRFWSIVCAFIFLYPFIGWFAKYTIVTGIFLSFYFDLPRPTWTILDVPTPEHYRDEDFDSDDEDYDDEKYK